MASTFIQAIEARQGLKVSCPEEVAFHMGFISAGDVRRLAEPMKKGDYGRYLLRMLEESAPSPAVATANGVRNVTESLLTEADRRQIEARGLPEEDVLRQIGLLTDPPGRIGSSGRRSPVTASCGFEPGKDGGASLAVGGGGRGRAPQQVRPGLRAPRPGCSRGLRGEQVGSTREKESGTNERLLRRSEPPRFLRRSRGACAPVGFASSRAAASGTFEEILSVLLSPPPTRPRLRHDFRKALIPFHSYPDGARTPFEEHLRGGGRDRPRRDTASAASTSRSPPSGGTASKPCCEKARPPIERAQGATLEVTFTSQAPSTDTLAVDEEKRPLPPR